MPGQRERTLPNTFCRNGSMLDCSDPHGLGKHQLLGHERTAYSTMASFHTACHLLLAYTEGKKRKNILMEKYAAYSLICIHSSWSYYSEYTLDL